MRTTAARLNETQRLARWEIFILLVFLMIDVYEHQHKILYPLEQREVINAQLTSLVVHHQQQEALDSGTVLVEKENL